jgi:ribosomal protein S27AE
MKLVLTKNTPNLCPRCGSQELHRSRRRSLLDHFLSSLFSLLPFRCGRCDLRHFRLKLQFASPSHETPVHTAR